MENEQEKESLTCGIVEKVTPIGTGTRVCIDTADILTPTEGVLTGNTGHGYLLVLSENRASETYPPRTFRINAGGLHQYLYQQGGTRYLEELRGGDRLVVYDGAASKEVPIGRVKMEKRNLVRMEVNAGGIHVSATLQDAESVFLLGEDGSAVSMKEVKEGDRIRCFLDEPGRHLGQKIEEQINEY
ncbi:3-dehydroquinate synthase II [Salibacterium halotolerans]|uniref:3-dehydroquinate synthase II n=1 Tax=Salibacterium halotolerans TaxID=1884432 RepID=A0A1I5RMG1_9BACI|nr:3-dehydroquinate synthase II [Salibacterium halotolerans]SFP59441.1 3-dehydroquinate synthase II [Salibacterium halotolerans]